MKRLFATSVFIASVLSFTVAFAAEKTVTLSIENMFCASCPYLVKNSLSDVAGVSDVKVSYDDKIAVVTFDDAMSNVEALTDATTNAGYPSVPLN